MKSVILFLLTTATTVFTDHQARIPIEGKCPDLPFVKDFNSTEFSGKWFSVKETAITVPCVTYQFAQTSPYLYEAYASPLNYTTQFEKINVEDFADGFDIHFIPYAYGGVMKVFATDYGTEKAALLSTRHD